ncbi:MAG: dihydrodipicolinate synthase family protein [Rhodospirillales bacterium]|nr:dihydrodipicolinate synthase family protein [Rhodospirillales bacterium]
MSDLMVSGQVIAPVTPFNAKGELMVEHFGEIVRWHLDCGVGGFLVAGDNGEAWALTADELGRVTRTAIEEVKGRVPVFVGASAITAANSIALAGVAADAGADGLCLQPQSYVLNGTTAEIVGRIQAVHKAVPLPILLYNHPGRTGLNMTPDILDALCGAVPVVGLKEASNDFVQLTRIIERFADRFAVLTGPAHYIIPAMELGAAGYISTGPELLGAGAGRILETAAMTTAERRHLHCTITDAFTAVQFIGTRPAGIKAALVMLGLPAGLPREPVLALSPDDEARLRDALVRCGILDEAVPRRRAS